MTKHSSTVLDPVAEFGDWLNELASETTQEESIERIARFEELKGKLEAAQARAVANLEKQRLAQEAHDKVPKADRGKGLGAEVGLARRESPARGKKFLDVARALDQDMPHTLAALSSGKIREEHAQLIAKETEVLSATNRRNVDRALRNRLGTAGPRELANEARAHVQRLDSKAAAARHRKAKDARRVTSQPAGDGMALLTAYGPAPIIDGIANKLRSRAKTLISAGKATDAFGNRRSRDQVAFDLFAEWCTGTGDATASPVELVVMMTPDTLLAHGDTPAWLAGHGPIPAEVAREWLANEELQVTLRKIFADATGTHLTSMESKARAFPANLRKMLLIRDNICRSPYCEASISDGDHMTPRRNGGATQWKNASGLCGACNQIKENRGWQHKGDDQTLTVGTPTGHTYTKTPGPLIPGYDPAPPQQPPEQTPRKRSTDPPIRTTPSSRRRARRLSVSQYLRC